MIRDAWASFMTRNFWIQPLWSKRLADSVWTYNFIASRSSAQTIPFSFGSKATRKGLGVRTTRSFSPKPRSKFWSETPRFRARFLSTISMTDWLCLKALIFSVYIAFNYFSIFLWDQMVEFTKKITRIEIWLWVECAWYSSIQCIELNDTRKFSGAQFIIYEPTSN